MAIPFHIIILLIISVIVQIFAIFMVPLSRGLTQPIPTIIMTVAFMIAIGIVVRVANTGINLSFLVPGTSAMIQLGAVAVGILAYGEAASLARVGALVIACLLVWVSNYL